MQKTTTALKACAIVINSLLAILLTLITVQSGSSNSWLIFLLATISCSILNIILLSLSKRLLTGAKGTFFLYLSFILNLCSLLGVIAGTVQWGIPDEPLIALTILIWFIFPIITPPAIFLTRRQLTNSNNSTHSTITCPNCATEIAIN